VGKRKGKKNPSANCRNISFGREKQAKNCHILTEKSRIIVTIL
jgi:hypothetical protein